MTKIYAHRGASIELPENTLPAFQRAVELGVDGIELDVHLSTDGVPVVIHDSTVDRTTDRTGDVSSFSAAELSTFDAGDGAGIPSLAEVFDLVGDQLHVDIEVKDTGAADAVLELLAGYPDTQFAISSFHWDVLRSIRQQSAGVELWPLTPGATDDAVAVAKELGAPQLAIWDRAVDKDVLKQLSKEGLAAWVWTVNDPEVASQFAALGVVGICTDDPAGIQRALT